MFTTTKDLFNKLFTSLVLLLLPLITLAQDQQPISLKESIQLLKLESTNGVVPVYYSVGFADRAEEISKQIGLANQYYYKHLNIDVEINVALLTPEDDNAVSPALPYGLPFVRDGVIMLPADTSLGAVKDMYAPFKESADSKIIDNLNSIGISYAEALNRMVDLIGLHELGHTQNNLFELKTKQAWFNEFMASYFGYCYMREMDPTSAVIWNNITLAGFEGYTPTYTSLDKFNELYFGVGLGNYVWFQDAFQRRVHEVYESIGIEFIPLVKEKLGDPNFKPANANELLIVLEEIQPGFLRWAELIKK